MIWLLNAGALAGREEAALELVSQERRARALACRPEEARLGILAGGLLLRHVLGVRDESLLPRNEWGKPSLPEGPCFSLSHAGWYAALAVEAERVGVDIEPLDRPFRRLSRQLFLPREHEWLAEAPDAARFYTLWTRLEAYTKADGRGLLLADREQCLLDTEGPCFLRTFVCDGHMISCARQRSFEPEFRTVPLEEVLQDLKNGI